MYTLTSAFTQQDQLPWREYGNMSLVRKGYSSQLLVTLVKSCSAKVLGIPDPGVHIAGQQEEKIMVSNVTLLPFI